MIFTKKKKEITLKEINWYRKVVMLYIYGKNSH